MNQARTLQKTGKQSPLQTAQGFPATRRRRGRGWLIALLVVVFLVAVGILAAVTLLHEDPVSHVYHDGGFGFRLVQGEGSQFEATIVSQDTTAPVLAHVLAVRRTGNLWNDLLAQLKNNARSYPVTEVSGLTSKAGPIDLSALAATTRLALDGQSIRYVASNFSVEATQTGGTLVIQTASLEGTATVPTQLFTDSSGTPLKVQLAPRFEAELLAKIAQIAGEQVQKSSDYEPLVQQIQQMVRPYAAVMSASATQAIQAKLDSIKNEEAKLQDEEGILLDVPLISQLPEFIAGCEAASTAMLISYAGQPVTTADIVAVMPYASNPSKGYVGNPRTWGGWTIYPSAMKTVVQKYLGSSVDLTGGNIDTIHEYLRAGKPVVCWMGNGILPGIDLHCICVTGYKQDTIYYNDPYLNIKNKAVSEEKFEHWWSAYGNKAMSY